MDIKHPLEAKMIGVPLNAENIYSHKEQGYFEYTWAGNNAGKHFKRIKKRVRFQTKMVEEPSDIIITELSLNNCSNLVISNINKRGFSITLTGIRASENNISFNWETI